MKRHDGVFATSKVLRSVRTTGVILVGAVLAASCTQATPDPTTTTLTPVNEAIEEELSSLIVVVTTAGAVVVSEPDGSEVSRIDPGHGATYRQPVFVDSNRVLFAEGADEGAHGLVLADASSGAVVWKTEVATPPFYYLPAPRGSSDLSTSLRNHPSGDGLLVELVAPNGTLGPLSTESPFYSSWSLSGDALAIHARNSELRLRTGEDEVTLAEPTGGFQAPVWTDAGLVGVRTVDDEQRIAVWRGEAADDLVVVDGFVQLVGSGRRIAVQSTSEAPTGLQASVIAQGLASLPGRRLLILDLDTAEVTTVTTEPSLLFQWDPTGRRLLYATLDDGEVPGLVWHIWDDGTNTDHGSFRPQPDWLRAVAPFFDQYAQSAPLWNRAGDMFAYPAIADDEAVVIVQQLTGASVTIPDAVWVTWSP